MYFVSFEPLMSDGEKYAYYIELIITELKECLNANAISYISEANYPSENNAENSQIINIGFGTNEKSEALPGEISGIHIIFGAGNPESKRLAEILKENFKNFYSDEIPIKIISDETKQDTVSITINTGFADNPEDMEWLRDNTDSVANAIVLSLCEYFGIPFIGCRNHTIGVANADATIFDKPSLNSKVSGNITQNSKVKINSQWEDWYIVGENGKLGYVQTKFVNV